MKVSNFTQAIKPIETRYAGCRFRSRTEARWAIAFDCLGHEWTYEQEGYILPSGCYLPDFLIGKDLWVEVKGCLPDRSFAETDSEKMMTELVLALLGPDKLVMQGVVVFGQPHPDTPFFWIYAYWGEYLDRTGAPARCKQTISNRGYLGETLDSKYESYCPLMPALRSRFDYAVKRSLSARFEHGEKG